MNRVAPSRQLFRSRRGGASQSYVERVNKCEAICSRFETGLTHAATTAYGRASAVALGAEADSYTLIALPR
jgi:hypothetical protein